MARVGIRELRQRARQVLRRVARGETVEITDRGEPIARLTPIVRGSPVEEALASGELAPPTGDPSAWPDPLPAVPGEEPLSETLRRLREHER